MDCDMDLAAAIRAVAPRAPAHAATALARTDGFAFSVVNARRAAHMIAQCAHESAGFTASVESLWYSDERLCEVWPDRFPTLEAAAPFAGSPERLANEVYGTGRLAEKLGNTEPGDGYRYRGRGWIHLTGRFNYKTFGQMIGADLIAKPELAAQPLHAWAVAIAYFETRERRGRTAFQWADLNNVEAVTRIVNGGLNGITDRRRRTAAALAALGEFPAMMQPGDHGPAVEALQGALAEAGYSPGALDGDYGPKTRAAVQEFQAAKRLAADGIAGPITLKALGLT